MANINRTIEQITSAIQALDLDPIKFKLMDKREGQGWSREKADIAELEYRRFLELTAKYPGETITLSPNADKFWHAHILDTMKYAQDCQDVFGYFLHHFPYFGMRGDEDAANLASAAVNTKRLYEQEFGLGAGAIEEASFCSATEAPSFCSAEAVRVCSAPETDDSCSASAAPSFCSRADDKLNVQLRPSL